MDLPIKMKKYVHKVRLLLIMELPMKLKIIST
jgi:hypothetical protein